MASGDPLFVIKPNNVMPTDTLGASLSSITGTSTPAERIWKLDFDDTTVEYADFLCTMPSHYAGTTGTTFSIRWSAAQNTNNGIWSAALRRVADDAEDLDTTVHTYDYNTTGDISPANVVGELSYDDITFLDGVDMDNVTAGDEFILRVKRPAPTGTKITGDTSIFSIYVKET